MALAWRVPLSLQGKPRMLISGKGHGCGTRFKSLRGPSSRIPDIQMVRGGTDINESRPEATVVISASQAILPAIVAINIDYRKRKGKASQA